MLITEQKKPENVQNYSGGLRKVASLATDNIMSTKIRKFLVQNGFRDNFFHTQNELITKKVIFSDFKLYTNEKIYNTFTLNHFVNDGEYRWVNFRKTIIEQKEQQYQHKIPNYSIDTTKFTKIDAEGVITDYSELAKFLKVTSSYNKMYFDKANLTAPICFNSKHRMSINNNRIVSKFRQYKLLKYINKNEILAEQNDFRLTHLVLTMQHNKEDLFYARDLSYNFKLMRKQKFWNKHIYGGVYNVETTYSKKNGNHTHLHCLVFQKNNIKVVELGKMIQNRWLATTSDSYITHYESLFYQTYNKDTKKYEKKYLNGVSTKAEMLKAIKETTKYNFKLESQKLKSMDFDALENLLKGTKRLRQCSTFGFLYDKKIFSKQKFDLSKQKFIKLKTKILLCKTLKKNKKFTNFERKNYICVDFKRFYYTTAIDFIEKKVINGKKVEVFNSSESEIVNEFYSKFLFPKKQKVIHRIRPDVKFIRASFKYGLQRFEKQRIKNILIERIFYEPDKIKINTFDNNQENVENWIKYSNEYDRQRWFELRKGLEHCADKEAYLNQYFDIMLCYEKRFGIFLQKDLE
jgi:hypothetical protein